MRHAVYLPPFASFGDVHVLVELAVAAEAAGWDGFFLWDHILYGEDVPFADAWIALAAIAASTSTIRIGPLITPLPRRRAWKVAREALTVDHLSGGRLQMGVGLGIDFWREFSGFGEPATDDRMRAVRTDEGIDVLRGLWTGETFSYTGETVTIDGVRFLPPPVQQPTIPIWAAALWPMNPGPSARAARCDGVMPFRSGGPIHPDDVAGLRDRLGVGPDFDVCLHGPPQQAAEYEAAGVSWFCLSLFPEEPLAEARSLVAAGPPR